MPVSTSKSLKIQEVRKGDVLPVDYKDGGAMLVTSTDVKTKFVYVDGTIIGTDGAPAKTQRIARDTEVTVLREEMTEAEIKAKARERVNEYVDDAITRSKVAFNKAAEKMTANLTARADGYADGETRSYDVDYGFEDLVAQDVAAKFWAHVERIITDDQDNPTVDDPIDGAEAMERVAKSLERQILDGQMAGTWSGHGKRAVENMQREATLALIRDLRYYRVDF